MRRFIAYILTCITIFLGIGVCFKPIATRINADLSYRSGKEITFRLKERESDDPSGMPKPIQEDGSSAKYYADVMESRIIAYGLSDYKIVTSGNDTIKVTLAASNDEEYSNIASLLSVNPRIELSNFPKPAEGDKEKVEEIRVSDHDEDSNFSWHSEKAYLKFESSATVLVMPIPLEARVKVEEMYNNAKKYEGENPKSSVGDDPKPEEKQSIILWMNRFNDDAFEDRENPNISKKIIWDKFNSSNFYATTEKDSFQIRFTPQGSDIASLRNTYNKAVYYMNLLNSTEVDFDCEAIRTVSVAPTVEELLIYDTHVHIAMSATFISLIIALIVISLILALFYRLGAFALISTMSLTTFMSFVFFVLFKPPFNIAAFVGFMVIALASLVTGIVYNHYLRDEVYKGRSLKKANFESSKKTTMIAVDISVILILLGIILYGIGGKVVASAGVVLIIGSVFNLLINTFVLKGLMWLLTNNTAYQDKNKLYLFNIKKDKVPDLSKEEKPSYFGPFIDKDLSKKKKLTGGISLALAVVSIVGLITFAATTKNVFNTSSYYANTNEVSFSIADDNENIQPISTESVKLECFDNIKNGSEKLKYSDQIEYYTFKTYENDKKNYLYHHTYVIKILEPNINSETYSYKDNVNMALVDIIDTAIQDAIPQREENTVRFATNEAYNISSDVGVILGASILSVVIISIYLWIRRYRLSRITSALLISIISGVISLGVITLTRINATPVFAIVSMLTMAVTFFISLFIMHKDKDLIKDERIRDLETRKTILKKAVSMAMPAIISLSVISIYLVINNLAFGNKSYLGLFLAGIIAIAISSASIITLFAPLSDKFDKGYSRVKIPEIKIRRKKKIKVKTNEPEEAVFIGIND